MTQSCTSSGTRTKPNPSANSTPCAQCTWVLEEEPSWLLLQGKLLIYCERKETWTADLQSCWFFLHKTVNKDWNYRLRCRTSAVKSAKNNLEKSNNPKNHLLIKRLMKHWNVLHVKRLRNEHRLQTSDYDVAAYKIGKHVCRWWTRWLLWICISWMN